MPSGPKKRRAAKKKNDTIVTTSANPTEERPVDDVELSKVASNMSELTVGVDVNTKIVIEMGSKENKEEKSMTELTSEEAEKNKSDDVFECFLQEPPVCGDTSWLDVPKNAQMGLEDGGNGFTFNQLLNNEISSSNETGDLFVESVAKEVQDSVKESFEISNNEPSAIEQPVLNDNDVYGDQMDGFGSVKMLVNVLVCQSNEMKLLAEKQKCLSEEMNLNLSKLMDVFNSLKLI